MLRRDAVDITVTAVGRIPLIDRTTNTVMFTLDREEAPALIADLTMRFDGADKVIVSIEADDIYPKDRN